MNDDESLADEEAPVTVADKPREPTEYERKLRREAASARVKQRAAETDAATQRAAVVEAQAKGVADVAEAVAQAHTASADRIVRAELKARALAAGMIDTDGLKLLDLSGVKLGDDGEVSVPDGFFEAAKKAKPYLFGAVSTASTAVPPSRVPTGEPRRAMDMTPDEYRAAKRAAGLR